MQFPKCAYPVLLRDTGPVRGYKGSAGLFRNYTTFSWDPLRIYCLSAACG
jgi:hypothetical protein